MDEYEKYLSKWVGDPVVGKIVLSLTGLIVIYALTKLLSGRLSGLVKESNNRYYIKKSFNFLGFVCAIVFLSSVFSDKLSSLSVALGVAGAGVAFALQEVIASVAGWFAIVFGRFYSAGDRVQVGGTKGDVIDIGVLRTTLMEMGEWVKGDLYTGRIVRVANSFIFKEPVFNYSADFPFLWDELQVPIKWGSDLKSTTQTLEQLSNELLAAYATNSKRAWKKVVSRYRIEDAKLDPIVTYSIDASMVTYTIRYIVDFKKRRSVKHELSEKIVERISSRENVEFASSSEYQLTSVSSLNVDLRK